MKKIIAILTSLKSFQNPTNSNLQININQPKTNSNQTENIFFKPKKVYKYKSTGIIDFLCLDSRIEKENFQKKIFSEKSLL